MPCPLWIVIPASKYHPYIKTQYTNVPWGHWVLLSVIAPPCHCSWEHKLRSLTLHYYCRRNLLQTLHPWRMYTSCAVYVTYDPHGYVDIYIYICERKELLTLLSECLVGVFDKVKWVCIRHYYSDSSWSECEQWHLKNWALCLPGWTACVCVFAIKWIAM